MNKMRSQTGVALLALVSVLLLGGIAVANGSGYTLDWWTVDGGGGTLSDESSGYSLGGSAGQPDAAEWSGGGYTLSGGFWGDAQLGPEESAVFLPLVLRSY